MRTRWYMLYLALMVIAFAVWSSYTRKKIDAIHAPERATEAVSTNNGRAIQPEPQTTPSAEERLLNKLKDSRPPTYPIIQPLPEGAGPKPAPSAAWIAQGPKPPLKPAISQTGRPYRGELRSSWQFYDEQYALPRKPAKPSRKPCMERELWPAQRFELPSGGGYIEVPRPYIKLVPCDR